jgi:hypothetical protein
MRYREIKTMLADHFANCLYLPVPDRGNIIALTTNQTIPWSRILLKGTELAKLSDRYGINFNELVGTAKTNNLSLSKRLLAYLHPSGNG